MNLLEETKTDLYKHGKTIEDIKWVGTKHYYVDVDKFIELANVKYDDGFGAPEVAENLIITGDDWWMERHEYDGSEWWEFKEIPTEPEQKLELKALTVGQADENGLDVSCGWETLERLNGYEELEEEEEEEEYR